MKKFIKRTLTCVLILASALSAKADYDFKVNGIHYNIKSLENRTCVVCNPNGEYSSTTDPNYSGNFVIPSTVNYNGALFTVVGIGAYAFSQSGLTSITIPNTVEEIAFAAFYKCKSLKNVKFSDRLRVIDDNAFESCYSLSKITLPQSLARIGKNAFSDCPLQGSLSIPTSCKQIGMYAFSGTYLKSIIVSDREGNIVLGDYCFSGIDSLYMGVNEVKWINFVGGREVIDIESSIYLCDKVTFGDNVLYMPWPKSALENGKISQITIGYNIKHVPEINMHIMRAVRVRNSTPPLADGFTDKTYVNSILYVPRGSKAKYQAAHAWGKFVNIREYDVHISPDVKERNKTFVINGKECVEIDGLYWQTKNVGAVSYYDEGLHQVPSLYDSIRVWEKQGWRLPTNKEFGSFKKISFSIGKIEYSVPYDNEKAFILFPHSGFDPYLSQERRSEVPLRYSGIRLVMDKSTYRRQQGEQRKKEEQLRSKEEEERLKARYGEINKLVEKNGATYAVNGSDMQYEFALENTNGRKDKSKVHTLVLRYAKNGALYMAINNGAANELETLFPDTKLEGTSKQWSEGYYKIATSSSNADVAKELSRILQGMCTAKDKFQQRKKAEKEEKMQESRINYAAWQLASLMAWPCGITSYDWKDSNKNIKKNILSVYPNMEVKMNVLQGNIKGIYIEIANGIELQNYHSYINLKPAKENRIAVQYTFSILKKRKLFTDQDSEIYANTLNCIKTILTDHLHFSQSQDGSYKIRNLKDKVDIEDLKITVNKYGGIQINFNVIR